MILGHLATQLDALSSILFADPVSMSQASQWSKTFEMHCKRGEGECYSQKTTVLVTM